MEPALSIMSLRMIRQNAVDFLKQEGGDTTRLMPMLPKRIIAICDATLAREGVMDALIEHLYPGSPNESWRVVVLKHGKEITMQVEDMKETLRLAKVGLTTTGPMNDPEYHAKLEASVAAVETWLVSIGALPPR